MKYKGMTLVSLAILSIAAAGWALQPAAVGRGTGPTWTPAQTGRLPRVQGEQGYGVASPIPPAYRGGRYEPTNEPGYPQYPYPPYRNPYYDGTPSGNFASKTVDWLLSFPSNLFNRVSDYLDGTFFPQAPATQGRGPAGPTDPGSGTHPPPASPYGGDSTTGPARGR
jgi:hypothetical protein